MVLDEVNDSQVSLLTAFLEMTCAEIKTKERMGDKRSWWARQKPRQKLNKTITERLVQKEKPTPLYNQLA